MISSLFFFPGGLSSSGGSAGITLLGHWVSEMRQYSELRLQMYSTQAVNKRESVTSSLWVKYKSNRGVLTNGMWFSMV